MLNIPILHTHSSKRGRAVIWDKLPVYKVHRFAGFKTKITCQYVCWRRIYAYDLCAGATTRLHMCSIVVRVRAFRSSAQGIIIIPQPRTMHQPHASARVAVKGSWSDVGVISPRPLGVIARTGPPFLGRGESVPFLTFPADSRHTRFTLLSTPLAKSVILTRRIRK